MDHIFDHISSINTHNYQKINFNKYQQGELYVSSIVKENDNDYVKIPKVSYNSLNKETYKTIFEKLVIVFENEYDIDMNEYKQKFFNTLSNDIYKSISKRHNVLKNSMFEFIHEKEYKLPINKDVLTLFSNILNKNIIVIEKKDYYVYGTQFNSTLVIDPKNTRYFDGIELAENTLIEEGYYENIDYLNIKMTELKSYIEKYDIQIDKKIKKKDDIIERIKEIKEIKN